MKSLFCAVAVTLAVTALAAASGPTALRSAASPAGRDTGDSGRHAAGITTVIFVDQAVIGGADNGTSWADAWLDLQDALDQAAGIGGPVEVRVAEGTYRPDRGTLDRSDRFEMHTGVKVFGGYPTGGSTPLERNPGLNVTVLSGDLAGDDAGTECTGAEENSLNVVVAFGVDASAGLDGFTITGGNPAQDMLCEEGGGMYIEDASPTVSNCALVNNCGCTRGGGVYVWNGAGGPSEPTFINCLFNGNDAPEGGGMFIDNGEVTMVNCTITQNHAGLFGGGVIVDGFGASLIVSNSIFWGNDENGVIDQSAQILPGPGSSLVMNYCTVEGWTGTLGGVGNNGDDPQFADSNGPDLLPGSLDDNLRLTCGSSGIDSGNNTAVPPDTCDLDGDGNIAEPIPVDLDHRNRFVNNVLPDTGVGTPPIVDRGAYEFLADLSAECLGDTNGDHVINVDDLVEVIVQWDCIAPPACTADVFADCVVNVNDLVQVIVNWGPCPVSNDECADRVAVELGPTEFHNEGATTNPGIPAFPCGTNVGNDVWFNYTAPCPGTLVINTCGSTFDTVLAVYNGASCPPGAVLACNDDAGAGTDCPGTTQSSVSVPLIGGQTVKIRVGGNEGDRGWGMLNLALVGADDDDCLCATPIAVGQTVTVDTNGATFDFTSPLCPIGGDLFNAPSRWLRAVGTGNNFTVELCGNPMFSFASRLNVYCGPCEDLECVADEPVNNAFCDPLTERLEWCTAPGAEYYIMIHGENTTGVADVTLTEGAPCGSPPCD